MVEGDGGSDNRMRTENQLLEAKLPVNYFAVKSVTTIINVCELQRLMSAGSLLSLFSSKTWLHHNAAMQLLATNCIRLYSMNNSRRMSAEGKKLPKTLLE